MIDFYQLPIFGILLTVVVFFAARALRNNIKFVLFNPVLIAITLIILFLVVFDIRFEDYNKGGKYLSFFLGPAIVALGVLFYEKYQLIRHNIYPFLLAVGCGGLISIASVSLISIVMNAPDVIIRSLVSMSVTTPIAIEITKITEGIPSLTAGVVIAVGVFGNAFGSGFLKLVGIQSQTAVGTALGTAAHGIGTARAIEIGPLPGAYSGLAMCVNGILTTLISPYVVLWIVGSI
ncbi:LrgB family protein [Gelidibacter salicanalis]|uniref:LrgB family protein n=1 Tax=Gelidibacter salicanalis TaxID=291193 RepID=A0A934NBM6_9FLAO|nr:LrgB family protein [Gelidibacter salicanalis]MBJ7879795.1 LrgB family protein [Gelidibacter salicanalis]